MNREEIIAELMELSNEARRQSLERNAIQFASFDLSDTAIRVMEYLYTTCRPLVASEIAAGCGLSNQIMTFALDSLEKKRYIERHPHESDRRKKYIVLSEEGRTVGAEIHKRARAYHEAMTEAFDLAEIEAFVRFRRKAMTYGRKMLEKMKNEDNFENS